METYSASAGEMLRWSGPTSPGRGQIILDTGVTLSGTEKEDNYTFQKETNFTVYEMYISRGK